MPNPLFNHRRDTSTDTQVEIPQPLEPTPESYAGPVFAYRGTEKHGVEPTGQSIINAEELDYTYGRPVEYAEEQPEPDAIPVRVVNSSAHEIKDFRVIRTFAGDQPGILVARNEKRSNLKIRNLHATKTIYVSDVVLGAAGTAFGYPVPAGTEFSLLTATTEIYGVSEDTTQIPIAVMYEYTIPVND